MEKRMQYLLLAGFAVVLALLVFSPKNALSARDDFGSDGKFIMQPVCDGTANNKPYMFILDTENKRLLLYDIVASKLRFCSARYIQYETMIYDFELSDKPNGSVREIKAAVEKQQEIEKEKPNGKNGK